MLLSVTATAMMPGIDFESTAWLNALSTLLSCAMGGLLARGG
jgi:hypothetical protein